MISLVIVYVLSALILMELLNVLTFNSLSLPSSHNNIDVPRSNKTITISRWYHPLHWNHDRVSLSAVGSASSKFALEGE